MLSQNDMEDFMEIDAALVEQDEVAAKLEKPSIAVRGGTNALDEVNNVPDLASMQRDYLEEGMRSLLSAGDQVSKLLAQAAKRS